MDIESEPLRQAAKQTSPIPFSLGDLFKLELASVKPELYLAHFGMAKTNTAAGLSLGSPSGSGDQARIGCKLERLDRGCGFQR